MTKMKVSDLAKSLNITSKELISFLNRNGFEEVKSPNKFIQDDAIGLIMKSYASKMQDGSAGKTVKPAPKKTPKEPSVQETVKQQTETEAVQSSSHKEQDSDEDLLQQDLQYVRYQP